MTANISHRLFVNYIEIWCLKEVQEDTTTKGLSLNYDIKHDGYQNHPGIWNKEHLSHLTLEPTHQNVNFNQFQVREEMLTHVEETARNRVQSIHGFCTDTTAQKLILKYFLNHT